jgi:hypothetical protein
MTFLRKTKSKLVRRPDMKKQKELKIEVEFVPKEKQAEGQQTLQRVLRWILNRTTSKEEAV